MVRTFNYYPEKEDNKKQHYALKGLIIGLVAALALIVIGNGIRFAIIFIIAYWEWILRGVLLIVVIKKVWFKKKLYPSYTQVNSSNTQVQPQYEYV